MGKFAVGKNAWGISDRSGFAYRLNDMRKEWTGSLVGREEYESKQPQLNPFRKVVDPQALRNARPDRVEPTMVYVGVPLVWAPEIAPVTAFGQVGNVTVTTNVPAPGSLSVNVSGVGTTTAVGSVTASGSVNVNVNVSGVGATTVVGSVTQFSNFVITVANPGAGNRYYIGGVLQATITLKEGSTYRLDQNNGSNSSHPLRFSTTSDGTHGGGSEYTTGVTTSGTPGSAGAYTQIIVASGAPTLYYYCTNHSGMGGQANTP